jgi:hypothetical protein
VGMARFEGPAECSAFMEQFRLADDLGKGAWSQAHGQRGLVDANSRPGLRRAGVGREQLAFHALEYQPIPAAGVRSSAGI